MTKPKKTRKPKVVLVDKRDLTRKAVRLYTKEYKGVLAVSKEIGMTPGRTRDLLRDGGVKIRGRGPVKWGDDMADKPLSKRAQQYVDLLESGLNQSEIADKVGVSRSAVHMLLKYYEGQGRIDRERIKAKAAKKKAASGEAA